VLRRPATTQVTWRRGRRRRRRMTRIP
jgi:hypothetical protein